MIDFVTDDGCDGLSQVNIKKFSDSQGSLLITYKRYLRHPEDEYDLQTRMEVYVTSKDFNWENKRVCKWYNYPNNDTILVDKELLDSNIIKVKYSQFGLNEMYDNENNSIVRLPQ